MYDLHESHALSVTHSVMYDMKSESDAKTVVQIGTTAGFNIWIVQTSI